MPKITFVNEHRIVEVESGRNVREVALECGIDLDVEGFAAINCGGRGLCTTCLCWIDESAPGAAGPRSFMERMRALGGWRRLACCTKIAGDVKVFSMPGGDERVMKQRPVSPPPSPAKDPSAARKPINEASTTAFPHGHPSSVASGTRKPAERVAAPAGTAEDTDDEDAESETEDEG
jgi:ferredoxin